MIVATIKMSRWYNHDCVIGRLSVGELDCFTLELPWRDNVRNVSCIPPGIYPAAIIDSPSNGRCIQLENVPGRSYIQIHAGNYTRDIEGCILVGDSVKYLDGDTVPDVTNSRNTLAKLLDVLPDGLFYVEVA